MEVNTNHQKRRFYNDNQKRPGHFVMDWIFTIVLFFALFSVGFGKSICMFEECSNKYKRQMDEENLGDPERSPAYCQILQTYLRCMKGTAKACRGELNYHGTAFAFEKIEKDYCPHKGQNPGQGSGKNRTTPHPDINPSIPPPSCKFFGKSKYRHCGFFGDPHLKTFHGAYQTCRVLGRWTLIDNPYMSVVVINKPVFDGSTATAPTKISVVVKGRSTPCTLEKSYEADSDFPLPTTFTDGTDRSGPDRTVVLESNRAGENRQHVEITLKYVATRLIIRKSGKYLAFSAKIPEEVIGTSRMYDDRTELCTTGCPPSEQISALSYEVRLQRDEALQKCQSVRDYSSKALTDNYLDWCVFDLMTAGTEYDFVQAAHSAQEDAVALDPTSLKNRTALLEIPIQSPSPSHSYMTTPSIHLCMIFPLVAVVNIMQ